nr:ribonuclease H-like domain-containing protein [Tanacetum cinerariifolium]
MAWDDTIITNTTSISPLPKSPFLALQNPHWNNAMHDEYNALVKNGTWILLPRPIGINFVRSMWLFKPKFYADGTLSCYKARLVANGSSQQLGIDCDETFSPVVKPTTIRTFFSLAVSRKWPIHHLDVKNTFLMGIYLKLYICTNHQALWTPGTLTMSAFCRSLYMIYPIQFNRFASTCITLVNLISLPLSIYYATFEELWILDFTYTLLLPSLLLGTQIRIGQAASQQDGLLQGVANVVAETAWLHNLLRELHSPLSAATLVYCDKFSATYLSANPV